MGKKATSVKETGNIKQGSVAEFFRKRTQLVGFDFGLNKHTQYAIEFLDNSLDAIESFQWKIGKTHPEYAFKLQDDLILESLSYFNPVLDSDLRSLEKQKAAESVDDEGFSLQSDGTIQTVETVATVESDDLIFNSEETSKPKEEQVSEEDDEEAKKLRALQKQEDELEEEVQYIMSSVNSFIFPIQVLVEREPFVIIQLTEREAQEVYADISKKSQEVFEYTLDIFDNGTGMNPGDLEKFGKYLASSKSLKLRQTRGSQGFGSPSAFSDAQNTTGKPITVVSKDIHHIYGTCSQFYTTSKNNKEYIVPPTDVTCDFEHGIFISLKYLNVKYRKGYIDSYIKKTALTNPHITIIFLDPAGNEEIYPRRVKSFPREPTYALPHPSSINIGDFQDKLRTSNNLTVSAFLQENYVRLSSKLAKKIIDEAEEYLQISLSLFNLNQNFINWLKNQKILYFMRFEDRIFGRSKKSRKKFMVYKLNEADEVKYWKIVKQINDSLSKKTKILKEIRRNSKLILKETDKKKIKAIQAKIKSLEKENIALNSEISQYHKSLTKEAKSFSVTSDDEVHDVKIVEDFEADVKELLISKTRPNELTQKQTEALFKAFKGQKYLAPPSDPAVPIGESVLETTLLKEYHLNPEHRTDLFLTYDIKVGQLESSNFVAFTHRILSKFLSPYYITEDLSNKQLYLPIEDLKVEDYKEFFLLFDILHAHDDDFIFGYTRPPTSGKGLAFVVEAAVCISPKIPQSKKAQQVLMRYVNRTPKMRDNSDCAIWKGVQAVNWKNYKVDTFDNSIPKGNIRILVNVSGPYVHLMFKSQSKNALAEDEVLLKEIKMCLERIGRKIRNYQNKRINRENTKKRSKVIEKFIPIFITSLMEIANKQTLEKSVTAESLERLLKDRLDGRMENIIEIPTNTESLTTSASMTISSSQNQDDVNKEKVEESNNVPSSRSTSEISKSEPINLIQERVIHEKHVDTRLHQRTLTSNFTEKDSITSESRNSSPLAINKSSSSISSSTKKVVVPDSLSGKEATSSSRNSKKSIKLRNSTVVSRGKPKISLKKSIPSKKSISIKKLSNKKSLKSPNKKITYRNETKPLIKPKTVAFQDMPVKKLTKPKSTISLLSADTVIKAFKEDQWYNIKDLLKELKITDIKDARYLHLKIKQLTREKRLLISVKSGKQYYKLNTNK